MGREAERVIKRSKFSEAQIAFVLFAIIIVMTIIQRWVLRDREVSKRRMLLPRTAAVLAGYAITVLVLEVVVVIVFVLHVRTSGLLRPEDPEPRRDLRATIDPCSQIWPRRAGRSCWLSS